MKKYPHTKQGMARRRRACEAQYSKHSAAKQFNPHNGEVHSARWLTEQRKLGRRRNRAMNGAAQDGER